LRRGAKADAKLFNEASQVMMVRDGNRTVIAMLNDDAGAVSRCRVGQGSVEHC
jgi:hypothetical protein